MTHSDKNKLEAERAAFNYDPNIVWAKQRVRVTLAQWEYRATIETTVGGNCKGFEIFDAAISNVFEELPSRRIYGDDYAYVTLTRANGDTLECQDEDLDGDNWLKLLVVCIAIIGIEAQEINDE